MSSLSSTAMAYQGHFRKSAWTEKLVLSKLFWVVFLVSAFAYPLYRSITRQLPPPLPVLFELPNYRLTNEFGKAFGTQELQGRPYIASFLFTNCPTTCVRIVETLQVVQKRIKGLGTKVAMVSFTVDPLNDTSSVLFKYAREKHANPYIWSFLTGNAEEVQSVVMGGFKLVMGGAERSAAADVYDIAHSEKLVLVDGLGRVRGLYGIDKDDVNRLMIELGLLINRPEENRRSM